MSTRLSRLLGATPTERRVRSGALVAAVITVPLAVAGLVSGAFADANDDFETIPAIVVNNDEMVTMTLPDGTEQPVLAGRQLVTELTGGDTAGFEWTISNDDEAAQLLGSGDAYAVLTIPSDFSSSVTSLSSDAPTQASLDIRTDDAHGYLAGAVAQSVGDAMSSAYGRELTAQYLEGFYSNLATVGGSLGDAADGATQISSGVDGLASGLGTLSNGVATAATGATEAANGAAAYADGVAQYTGGVNALAGGLGQLDAGAAGLGELSAGIGQYTGGVSTISGSFQQLQPGLLALIDGQIPGGAPSCAITPLPTELAQVCSLRAGVVGVAGGLSSLTANGTVLAAEASAGIAGVQDGIAQSAAGAARLSGGSAELRAGGDELAAGVGELATGLGQLSAGAADAASGATQLASGADELANGLASGAEQASALTDLDAAKTAGVVAEPVTATTTREHAIDSVGEVIGMLSVPVGLWIGAMATFLVFRPFGREALRSTASTAGLVGRALARAGLLALAQAVAVVLLLHGALGVEWMLLPQTLAFAALLALAFTAVHAFLAVGFGRAGMLVSLVLVALQLAASGGLSPIEVLSGPFQAVSPFLPLTWAVQGMQLIVAGAGGGAVAAAAGAVASFGILGVLGTAFIVARRRGIRSIGFAATALG